MRKKKPNKKRHDVESDASDDNSLLDGSTTPQGYILPGMPRRRKRSTQQKKPSLIFTESPVNIQTHVPTPVLCARHPPTAQTVSVSELEDLSWVSPQFDGRPGSDKRHGKRQVTRQRRMSVGVTLGTNKENAHHGTANVMGNKQSKFKSLKFVGDQTAIASLAEDVDISCDTETTEDERAEIHPKISDIETSCDDHNVRKQILVRSKRKCGHRYTDLGASPESHAHDTHIDLRKISIGKSCNFEPNDDHHDIRSKTDINDKSCENRTELEGVSSSSCIQWGRESENNLVSSSSGLEQLDGKNLGATNKAKRRRNRKRKTCNLKTVLQSRFNLSAISTDSGAITTDSDSSDSVLEMQDNLDITLNRRRKCTDVKSPVKRLFATQLDAVSPVSLKKKPLCQSASNMDNEVLLLGSCSIDTIPNTESSDFSDVSTPLRRSSRIAANLRQLAAVGTTPLSKLDRVMIVLAPDTPDSEKDWTLRKRQVKGRHINSAI